MVVVLFRAKRYMAFAAYYPCTIWQSVLHSRRTANIWSLAGTNCSLPMLTGTVTSLLARS